MDTPTALHIARMCRSLENPTSGERAAVVLAQQFEAVTAAARTVLATPIPKGFDRGVHHWLVDTHMPLREAVRGLENQT